MDTLLRQLKPFLHLYAMTVTGRTLGEALEAAGPGFAQDVVRPFEHPIHPQDGLAVLLSGLCALRKLGAHHPGDACTLRGRHRRRWADTA